MGSTAVAGTDRWGPAPGAGARRRALGPGARRWGPALGGGVRRSAVRCVPASLKVHCVNAICATSGPGAFSCIEGSGWPPDGTQVAPSAAAPKSCNRW
jgi:hypothetical protein